MQQRRCVVAAGGRVLKTSSPLATRETSLPSYATGKQGKRRCSAVNEKGRVAGRRPCRRSRLGASPPKPPLLTFGTTVAAHPQLPPLPQPRLEAPSSPKENREGRKHLGLLGWESPLPSSGTAVAPHC
nr:hypothetical protein Itr_chr09CG14960 [Ipomoea trifida]